MRIKLTNGAAIETNLINFISSIHEDRFAILYNETEKLTFQAGSMITQDQLVEIHALLTNYFLNYE